MLVGDTHGQTPVLTYKIAKAHSLGIDRLFVLGDFGHWPGVGGIEFLDAVNTAARKYNVKIFALGGNHEWWDDWERRMTDPGRVEDKSGFVYIRSNILYAPKVHYWKWNNRRFFVAGGAVSIDKKWRVRGESWWPGEVLTEEQVESIEQYTGEPVDVLLTHDCSNYSPHPFSLVPDPDSQAHRRLIDRVIAAVKPGMHFHGHMHAKYEWINSESHGARYFGGEIDTSEWNGISTSTFGLECDGDRYSWGILDTDDLSFNWAS